jgi:hypothetical protein
VRLAEPTTDVQEKIVGLMTTALAGSLGLEPTTAKAGPFVRDSLGYRGKLRSHNERALDFDGLGKAPNLGEDSRNGIRAISPNPRWTAPDHHAQIIQLDVLQMR